MCGCERWLMGTPSTKPAKSVPWSRLKPRRKYWLALPPEECSVAIMPGMTSTSSAARLIGRVERSL